MFSEALSQSFFRRTSVLSASFILIFNDFALHAQYAGSLNWPSRFKMQSIK